MRWLLAVVLFATGVLDAQTLIRPSASTEAQGVPQLSPQAAYDEASRPVEIVHRAVGNWSEVEQASLAVAVGKAQAACAARSPGQFTGEDLLAYARLCAFAQMWLPVEQAATAYLVAQSAATPEDKQRGFPNLSMAFDYVIQASLHLKNPVNAFGTAQTMLRTVAYDDLVSEAADAVVRYVQLVQTDEAVTLLEQRQPQLLAMLKSRGAGGNGNAFSGSQDAWLPSARPPMTTHDVYVDAIALPAMQQFARQPGLAAASFAEVEAALPQNLSPDDAILIAAARRQYQLLGAPLPMIAASASLLGRGSTKAPDLNRWDGGVGAFLLFPYWCAQCVAMNPHFNEANLALRAEGVQFYALLAEDPLPQGPKQADRPVAKNVLSASGAGRLAGSKSTHVEPQAGTAPSTADQLMGTATLIVPAVTLDTFAATDFPLLVATDGCGVVRYVGVAPDNVLADGGLIYQVAERVLKQWPVASARSTAGASARVKQRCGVLRRQAGDGE